MWLNNPLSSTLQLQFAIQHKFATYRADSLDLELFSSQAFGQLALVHYKDRPRHARELLIERFASANSEMLAYIPYCVHTAPKRALLCGTLNGEIAYLLSSQGLAVDLVLPHREAFETLSGFLPHYRELTSSPTIGLHDKFLGLEAGYDLMINLACLGQVEFQALAKLASKESILIFRLSNPYLEPSLAIEELALAREFFNVLMPFVVSSLQTEFYVFASKRFHPLADLILQRSEMLEELEFYNANLHTSVFRFPRLIQNLLAPLVKN